MQVESVVNLSQEECFQFVIAGSKAEVMRSEPKQQVSSQHFRAVSLPECWAVFVEELESRREATGCLNWRRDGRLKGKGWRGKMICVA